MDGIGIKEMERIITENTAKAMNVNGRGLVFGKFTEVCKPYFEPEVLKLNDLTSFAKIIQLEASKINELLLVQIQNENIVTCISSLDDEMRRKTPFTAICENIKFPFERWLDYESFIIGLRSKFIDNSERDALIKMTSSIKQVEDQTIEDNGVTQSATMKSGSMLKEGQEVKSIVKLRPYRIFNEVEQPESEFLFRISKQMQFALFEADGGKWKIDARNTIKEFLNKLLEKEISDGKVEILV